MTFEIHFTHEPIVVPPENRSSREVGASLEFQGIVREMENGQALKGLFYEAYEPMARRRLEYHLSELGREHPCLEMVFIHRLGWVPVGEASLFIRVLGKHRGEALKLLGELVDRLKLDVPIWKQVRETS
jgi:molybdopterin synthase catalytic subunit